MKNSKEVKHHSECNVNLSNGKECDCAHRPDIHPSFKQKEVKHTPGPWHKNINAKYPIYAGEAPKHEIVAFMDTNNPNAEGNYSLIAAAPELLEALKAIATIQKHQNTDPNAFISNLREIAAKAIAKAQGK